MVAKTYAWQSMANYEEIRFLTPFTYNDSEHKGISLEK
jgi:hypothetical protein